MAPPGMNAGSRETDAVFHPITVGLMEDTTDVTCAGCGFTEHTGSGAEGHAAHGADHAIATGHVVTERRVRTTVISERGQAL